jgi:hypothetical protein
MDTNKQIQTKHTNYNVWDLPRPETVMNGVHSDTHISHDLEALPNTVLPGVILPASTTVIYRPNSATAAVPFAPSSLRLQQQHAQQLPQFLLVLCLHVSFLIHEHPRAPPPQCGHGFVPGGDGGGDSDGFGCGGFRLVV